MVTRAILLLAGLATLGLTTGPKTSVIVSSSAFETLSTLMTGIVLLLVARAARRGRTITE